MGGQAVNFQIIQASDHGSFSVSGQDVTFLIETVLVADHGSFSVSGQNVSFRASMGVGAGSFTTTGQDVSFRVSVVASGGSYSLSGQSITALLTLIANHGAFTLTGQDVTLSQLDATPAFEVDFALASIKTNDLGLHTLESDQGWYISTSDIERLNLAASDLGLRVVHAGVRLNVRGDE